jgi:hypothetical protein
MTDNLVTHVCNAALYRLGQDPITDIEDGSEPANICKEFYGTLRDSLLVWKTWPWATVRQSLVRLLIVPASDYAYYYALPTMPKCLRIIDPDIDTALVPYQREVYVSPSDPTSQIEVIASDSTAFILRYIGRVNESVWPPLAINALAVSLAATMAPSISGKASLRQTLLLELYGPDMRSGLQGKLSDIAGHEDTPGAIAYPDGYLNARWGTSAPYRVGP